MHLRVVWPILDEALFDHEALRAAARDWPWHVRQHRVDVTGRVVMRVVDLNEQQQRGFGAQRVVLCEAPVVRRVA